MNEAVRAGLQKYATFTGRSSRSEYWFFILFGWLCGIGAGFIAGIAHASALQFLPSLALFIPNIAVGIRRMHDTDHSGWFVLVPIYNIILLCTKGTEGSNRFGEPSIPA